jgi:hypothetical protein
MRYDPLLGIPRTLTNIKAGPGEKRLGLGGTGATWRIIEPSSLTVKVLFNCKRRCPKFMACVLKPPRWITHVAEVAAVSAGPEYELAGIVILKKEPPYVRVVGIPVGAGRVEAEK